jgi:hypothetical protein
VNEEIKFSKELQEELNTQDTVFHAAPRYWGIINYRTVPAHEDYNATRIDYIHNDGDHTVFDDTRELKEFLTDFHLEDLEGVEAEELKVLLEDSDTHFDDLWEFVEENLNEDGFFNKVPVMEEEFVVPSAMFLTKAEAERHLELNHYHYSSKAHIYAMTAWRAPKVERLLKILETFDWDKVQIVQVAE